MYRFSSVILKSFLFKIYDSFLKELFLRKAIKDTLGYKFTKEISNINLIIVIGVNLLEEQMINILCQDTLFKCV